MRIQYLTIIFVIIILPVIIITSVYNRMQINTIELQKVYDARFIDATYDAIKAYELNSAGTNTGSQGGNQDESNRRNIEASINTFITSITTGLGVGGYGDTYIKKYMPAALFMLYDKYYLYSPTFITNVEGKQTVQHVLQQPIYYSQRYIKGNTDVVIVYTLDNYITIYGKVKGEYKNESGYLNAYLLSGASTEGTEELSENLFVIKKTGGDIYEEIPFDESRADENAYVQTFIKNYKYFYQDNTYDSSNYRRKTYYDEEAGKCFYYNDSTIQYIDGVTYTPDESYNKYAEDSRTFTQWVQENLGDLTISSAVDENKQPIDIFRNDNARFLNIADNNPEETYSLFGAHKREVIKRSVEKNLEIAINNYDRNSVALDTTYHFKMPVISEQDWDKMLTNISFVAFIQGLPMGFKTYNNYLVVTGNANNKYITEDLIYFQNVGSNVYHRIGCTELDVSRTVVGYRSSEFDKTKGVYERKLVEGGNKNIEGSIYYYKHGAAPSYYAEPCYYCIVNALSVKLADPDNPETGTTKGLHNIFDETSVDYNWSQAAIRRQLFRKALGRETYNIKK